MSALDPTVDAFAIAIASAVREAVAPALGDPGARVGVGTAPGGDVTMAIDEIAEHVVERMCGDAGDIAFYSEDRGYVEIGRPRAVLVVDPIDGTRPAAAGLEYHFGLFEHESFLRLDAEYEARAKWPTAGLDPNTSQFDEANFYLPSTTFVSLRGGMQFGGVSLQAFIDNLTDSHTVTDYNNTINPLVTGVTRLQRDYTFRPRTFGITAIYRR